ncbi:SirB1 family protein [Pseudomonas sp. Marseille-QA0892]
MTPRDAFLDCLTRTPAPLLEAGLWIAAEHDPKLDIQHCLEFVGDLARTIGATVVDGAPHERAQALVRQLIALGFAMDDDRPLTPAAALLDRVLERKRGQPLSLAIVALECARRIELPLEGVGFPGYFLLRAPGADHCLDPCSGRRLYTSECRELLRMQAGPLAELSAAHLKALTPGEMLTRLSRNLRELHRHAESLNAALKDASRVLEITQPTVDDHLARAWLYQRLDCLEATRHDLERALLITNDAAQRVALTQQLRNLPNTRGPIH